MSFSFQGLKITYSFSTPFQVKRIYSLSSIFNKKSAYLLGRKKKQIKYFEKPGVLRLEVVLLFWYQKQYNSSVAAWQVLILLKEGRDRLNVSHSFSLSPVRIPDLFVLPYCRLTTWAALDVMIMRVRLCECPILNKKVWKGDMHIHFSKILTAWEVTINKVKVLYGKYYFSRVCDPKNHS